MEDNETISLFVEYLKSFGVPEDRGKEIFEAVFTMGKLKGIAEAIEICKKEVREDENKS